VKKVYLGHYVKISRQFSPKVIGNITLPKDNVNIFVCGSVFQPGADDTVPGIISAEFRGTKKAVPTAVKIAAYIHDRPFHSPKEARRYTGIYFLIYPGTQPLIEVFKAGHVFPEAAHPHAKGEYHIP
jgi:hypothetical protein